MSATMNHLRLGLAITTVLCAGVVHADDASDKKAHEAADAGAALFEHNDFAGAATKFREAYDANHDPSYLFNIAQAYRHAGDCIRSADYYGRFLAVVPHPPSEDKIRVWYASELKCAKERAASQPIEPDHGTQPTKSDTQPTKSDTQVKSNETKLEPAPAPVATTTSRHTGIALALAGAGVVGLGVGGFFAWDANFLSDRRAAFLDRCSVDNRCSSAVVDDYDHRGSRANTLMIVGFTAGGIALAASAAVYLFTGSESAPPVAVAPVRGGAVVATGFAW